MSPLDRVINAVAGGSPSTFGKLLGESPQTINNWRNRGVPADKCLAVVALAPDLVTAVELRPDVFKQPAAPAAAEPAADSAGQAVG